MNGAYAAVLIRIECLRILILIRQTVNGRIVPEKGLAGSGDQNKVISYRNKITMESII